MSKLTCNPGGIIVVTMMFLCMTASQNDNNYRTILGGIENVANTATNFLSGIMRQQGRLIDRVTGTASEYINSAVERPRNLLINATRVTTDYIDSAASRGLEFKLRRFLEKLRTRMPYGVPELGIPPMEPLHLDEVDIEIDNQEIGNLSIVVEDLSLHGLSTFVVNKAKLSLIGPTIAANVTFPRIQADGLYNISGILGYSIPLAGAGPFKGNIYDFQLYVNTVLGYYRGVYLRTFDLDFSLKSMDVNLENFMNDDELGQIMSKVFQELLPKALDVIKPKILPPIKSYIGGKINETINHLTMRDIINMLVGTNVI